MAQKKLGTTTEPWFKNLNGIKVYQEGLVSWKDFSKSGQVIFGYPERAGTYAFIFPTQVDSSLSDGIKVFLFLEVDKDSIVGLSYSVIDIGFDGGGKDMKMKVFEPDRAFIDNILFSTIDSADHDKLQAVIDDRLREMDPYELVKIKEFFTQVYNDKRMQDRYGKIIDERNKNKAGV